MPAPWRRALSTRLPSACSSRSAIADHRDIAPARRPRLCGRPRSARTPKRPRDRVEELAGRSTRVLEREPTLVDAREDEQVLGERARAGRPPRPPSGAPARALRAAGPAKSELELGPEQGERRPQLVARVGDEAALALEPGLEAAAAWRSGSRRDGGSRRGPSAAGSRRPGRSLEISAARRRIASTGRRAAAASRYPTKEESSSATGPATKSWVKRRSSASSRSSSEAPTTRTTVCPSASTGMTRSRAVSSVQPGHGLPSQKERARDARAASRCRHEQGRARPGERCQQRAIGSDHLGEPLVVGRRRRELAPGEIAPALAHERRRAPLRAARGCRRAARRGSRRAGCTGRRRRRPARSPSRARTRA